MHKLRYVSIFNNEVPACEMKQWPSRNITSKVNCSICSDGVPGKDCCYWHRSAYCSSGDEGISCQDISEEIYVVISKVST
jgi:hypothetical protein